MRVVRGRLIAYGLGAALIGVGGAGLLRDAAETDPVGWLVWVAGAALVHDLLVVPAVLGVALLTGRLPASYRRPVRVSLVLAASVSAVALPMVLGLGRRAGDPSRLPQAYGVHLAVVLALIGGAGAAAVALRTARVRRGRSRRPR
ncbi:hypothetical protein [Actinoallomurus rhizosphaericola]|uniref:hypothetical protein n=1 Tax=Actinoallomurus rhizosphaericola TaxID=2952536 RepID=UPI002090E8EA|nr:hypothetical protein [Actinoallomurus rhizosphaericola]MCO5992940.1 hypothetical protein [Actinoallomurus rhizosphaericola]